MSWKLKGTGKYCRDAAAACGLVRCAISARSPAVPLGTTWYRGTALTGTPFPVLPVVGIQVYRQDVVVVRQPGRAPTHTPERGEVKVFSRKSRQRLAFVASNTDVDFTSMLTLTYPRNFPNDGDDVKRDFKVFRDALRRHNPGLSMLWFLEFQRRGAPHIHIMLHGIRVWRPMQLWVSKTWYRICGTGDIRHLAAGTRLERVRNPHGARNYATKYAHKMKQKSVPKDYRNVGRFWGHSNDVRPVMRCETACTNDDLVGALESTGWEYLKGDTVRYHTLYGAAPNLTKWMDSDILVLSTSRCDHSEGGLHKRRQHNGYPATPYVGRRVRQYHAPYVRDGGGNHVGADAD